MIMGLFKKKEQKVDKNLQKKREIIHKRMNEYQKENLKQEKVAPEDSFISLQHINKIYPNHVQAVFDFNLEINQKEFIVFVGPSGCGKSTTLRMIAGLEEITAGDLYIDKNFVNEYEPKDRDCAMVFQSYALYPHMSVKDNMSFALKMQHKEKEEIDQRVNEAAKILQIEEYLDRKPAELSGGQKQRVALGRAIVRTPKVFLMDEPLSNLDAKLRVQMRSELVSIHRKIGATTIYVTHDQTEAMTMADRIVVMKDGYIQQIGTPKEIYNQPANIFVSTFIGSPSTNIFEVEYNDGVITFKDSYSFTVNKEIKEQHDVFYKKQIEKANERIDALKKLYEEYASSDDKKKSKKDKFEISNDSEVNALKENIQYFEECLKTKKHNIKIGIRSEDVLAPKEASLVKNKTKPVYMNIFIAELLGNEYFIHYSFNDQDLVGRLSANETLDKNKPLEVCFNIDKIKYFDEKTELNLFE